MTRKEFSAGVPAWGNVVAVRERHRQLVAKALAQGKRVPANVLADYPELVRAYKRNLTNELYANIRYGPITLTQVGDKYIVADRSAIGATARGRTYSTERGAKAAFDKITKQRAIVMHKTDWRSANELLAEQSRLARGNPISKEPWQMRRAEFMSIEPMGWVERRRPTLGQVALQEPQNLPVFHQMEIRAAIRAGKPVYAEVLADYPQLTPTRPSRNPTISPELFFRTMGRNPVPAKPGERCYFCAMKGSTKLRPLILVWWGQRVVPACRHCISEGQLRLYQGKIS